MFVICCLLFILPLAPSLSGTNEKNITEEIYHLTYTVEFSADDLLFSTKWGYDVITLDQQGHTMDPGKPMVPMKYIRLALPGDMKVTSLEVVEVIENQIPGSYTLLPGQEALPISVSYDETMFVQPDYEIYSSDNPYPEIYVEFHQQSDLAGQVMVDISVYPIRYIPNENIVSFVSSLTFQLSGTDEYVCTHYLSPNHSEQSILMYKQMAESMVFNPDQIFLRQSPNPQTTAVPPGNYDYVIITQSSWVSAFQPLADWKTQKGIPANIVTLTWIYNSGGYSGSNLEKIRAFIQDAYNTWGTVYFLLGGDTNVVPCHYQTFSSVDPEPIPNDTFYARFGSSYTCNVHVGRASVTGPGSGTGQIGNFINKILNYEKNPPLSNFAKRAGFFGFDLDSSTYSEQLKISIRNTYVPSSWSMTTVYDSHSGNHRDNVIAAINAGQNIMNHADHCFTNYIGTGSVNHGWGLYNSDMNALTNANKQGIMYSLGCWPAAYDEAVCIAESFVRNSNGGGVAFVGNSRYGWYNPGTYDTLSTRYDRHFFKALFPDNNHRLGPVFSSHKNTGYQWDFYGYYKYIFTELTLLGDPEMPIWKENPSTFSVSHPSQIPITPSSFTVTVTSGGSPVNQAYVCVWKGTDIYQTGITNSAGQKTFSLVPSGPGQMYVTVTKQNYIPYEAIVLAIDENNNPPNTPQRPSGPSSGKINVEYTYSTKTIDPEGDNVYYQWNWGDGTTSDWYGPYSSGAQVTAKHRWTVQGSYSIRVKAKDIYDAESAWSEPLAVVMPLNYNPLGNQLLQHIINFLRTVLSMMTKL
ncbi:MAG: C25 family cysteine peptidase [Thermoplasmatota archaeon]